MMNGRWSEKSALDEYLPPDVRLDEAKHDHAEQQPRARIKALRLHLLLARP